MASSPSLVDTIEVTCTGNQRPHVHTPSSNPSDISVNVNSGPVPIVLTRNRASSRSSRCPPVKTNYDPHGPSFVHHYIESGRGLNDLFDLRADFNSSAKAQGKRGKPTRIYHPGAIKAYVPEDRFGKIRGGVPIQFRFACWKKGELMEDRRHEVHYYPKHHDDAWLIGHMNYSYATKLGGSYFSFRTIGLAKYIRFEDRSKLPKKFDRAPRKELVKGKEMVVTAQQEIQEFNPQSGIHNFVYRFHHPPRKGRSWLERMESLAGQAEGDTYFIIELFETPNTSAIYVLLALSIAVSTAIGVSWAILKKDVSAGIGIAAYITGCVALFLALMGAGSFIGLEKPDSYSWAYDTATGNEAWETAKMDQNDIIFGDKKHRK